MECGCFYDLSSLPGPTGEQKRARNKQKKTVEDRNRKKIKRKKVY
jgi:hypothetical protein